LTFSYFLLNFSPTVRQGLKEAKEGKVKDLGSFAKYAGLDDEDDAKWHINGVLFGATRQRTMNGY